MKTVIGLDVGISTTKIVGIRDGEIVSPMRVRASDAITSLYGAFGKYMNDNQLSFSDIERVMLTGVGASFIGERVYDLPTGRVDEFAADAFGARQDMDIDEMIVVSMGTGTTIVKYDKGIVTHIGGIGIGGGTMAGLSRLLLGTDDFKEIVELANKGDIRNIDLTIGDVCRGDLPDLPTYATASLFGKAHSTATKEDIAIGIVRTVVQTIGSATVLAAKNTGIRDFFMIGNLSQLPQCKKVFKMMEGLYNVRFHIPPHSEFATAIGAALSPFA